MQEILQKKITYYLSRIFSYAKVHTKIIVFSCVITAVVIFSFTQTVQKNANKKATITPTTQPTITQTPFNNWQTYENKKRGFTVLVPPNWNIDEVIGRAIFTPIDQKKIGSLSEITITILNNPAKNQPLTTEQEFNEWLQKDVKKEVPEKGRLYKLDNLQVAGYSSVTLVDLGKIGEQDNDDWSLVTWFRKGNENYYINAKGTEKLSDADIRAYNYMLMNFTFTK